MYFIGLVQNLAFLIALAVIYPLVSRNWQDPSWRARLSSGVLFGLVAVVCMVTSVPIVPGVYFDGRAVILAIAGFVGGPIVALTAGGLALGFRTWLGGDGVAMGTAVIASASALGVLFHYWRRWTRSTPTTPILLAFGVGVHAVEAGLIVLLPAPIRGVVLEELWFPLLVLYPLATVVVARIFLDYDVREADRRRLAASELRFRAVVESSGDPLLIVDRDGQIVFANVAAVLLLDRADGGLDGTPLSTLLSDQVRTTWIQRLRDGLHVAAAPLETMIRSTDGGFVDVEVTVSSWKEDGVPYMSLLIRDIQARKEKERELRVLGQVVEQAVDSVIVTDADGAIEYVNPAFERITGWSADEVIGRTPRVLKSGRHSSDFYDELWVDLQAGRPYSGEMINLRRDGTEYTQHSTIFPIVDEHGRVERLVGIGVDVTQERHLEAELRQAQKMEAVGQLAGGIAHDFNNLLAGVLTNAQLLDLVTPPETPLDRELIGDIVGAARRGAELVKRLMSLSRDGAGIPATVDLRTSIDEAARTIRRIVPENIEFVVRHAEDPIWVHLDETELHQALFNLCNNARDAMVEGGSLEIRTERAGADTVVLSVRDTGSGILPEHLERIFEPFFTTKEVGKGTGLGMAMVHRFATRARGSITVESRPNQGTTVRLALPIADPPAAEVAPRSDAVGNGHRADGAVALLAEDDDVLRRISRKILEDMGYRVLEARDGDEASRILDRNRDGLDLVFADVVMPRGGGPMLYRRTRSWGHPPAFLLTSGHSERSPRDRVVVDAVPFLPKPWTIDDLRTALDRARVFEEER